MSAEPFFTDRNDHQVHTEFSLPLATLHPFALLFAAVQAYK